MKTRAPIVIFLIFLQTVLFAQRDTEFWFAAPEITKGQIGSVYDNDNPTVFRISTYDSAAVVTISLPADPSFPTQQFDIPSDTTITVDMGSWVETIENKPANQILNKGILIRSTQPITAYYEIMGELRNNPEVYVLKGKNALGNRFYTPFQTFLDNSNLPIFTPAPHAAFDIVATQNNTSVTITPTRDIVGHAADVPFTVVLNRGQTFSCEAVSQLGSEHPNASLVISNKPIAITVKDDLLDGLPVYNFPWSCRNQAGDQIVPVESLGKKHVVRHSLLIDERVIIIATEDGTVLKHNGNMVGIFNAGASTTVVLPDLGSNPPPSYGIHFITGSKPIYVFHIAGIQCEVAGEIVPSLDCSGSQSVRFVRTSDENFVLYIVTRSGYENGFLINGDPDLLDPYGFDPVPGSDGEFVSTAHSYYAGTIPSEESILVENTKGALFHLGFTDGLQTTGCRYGFLTDFHSRVIIPDTVALCNGNTVEWRGMTIGQSGDYEMLDSLSECDTLYRLNARVTDFVPGHAKVFLLCPGDNVTVNGKLYTAPGTYVDTLFTDVAGECDTIRNIYIDPAPIPKIYQTLTFCPGDTVFLGSLVFTAPFVHKETLSASAGCDTIRTIIGVWPEQDAGFLPDSNIVFCPGTPVVFHSPYPETVWNEQEESSSYNVTAAGRVTVRFPDPAGCIQRDTVLILPCCDIDKVYVPNVFSPNLPPNDRLNISVNPVCTPTQMRIYDRWGTLVYQTDQPETEHWDGTFNGKNCAPGVYIWVLEIVQTGQRQMHLLKGDITIIR